MIFSSCIDEELATLNIIAELEEEKKAAREHLYKIGISKLLKEEVDQKEIRNEQSIRQDFLDNLLSEPQKILLNQAQTRKFYSSNGVFIINDAPLRGRVLSQGEKVIIYTEESFLNNRKDKTFSAEVISATLCTKTEPNPYGLTNLVLKKLQT